MLRVLLVKAGAQVDELLACAYVAFSYSVIDAGLPVFILAVNIVALSDKEVNSLRIAFSCRVKKRCLLQRVLLDRVHAHLCQHLDHFESQFFVGHDAGRENGRLTEIFGLINQVGTVNIRLTDHTNHLFNFAAFDLFKEGPVEGALLAGLLQKLHLGLQVGLRLLFALLRGSWLLHRWLIFSSNIGCLTLHQRISHFCSRLLSLGWSIVDLCGWRWLGRLGSGLDWLCVLCSFALNHRRLCFCFLSHSELSLLDWDCLWSRCGHCLSWFCWCYGSLINNHCRLGLSLQIK